MGETAVHGEPGTQRLQLPPRPAGGRVRPGPLLRRELEEGRDTSARYLQYAAVSVWRTSSPPGAERAVGEREEGGGQEAQVQVARVVGTAAGGRGGARPRSAPARGPRGSGAPRPPRSARSRAPAGSRGAGRSGSRAAARRCPGGRGPDARARCREEAGRSRTRGRARPARRGRRAPSRGAAPAGRRRSSVSVQRSRGRSSPGIGTPNSNSRSPTRSYSAGSGTDASSGRSGRGGAARRPQTCGPAATTSGEQSGAKRAKFARKRAPSSRYDRAYPCLSSQVDAGSRTDGGTSSQDSGTSKPNTGSVR